MDNDCTLDLSAFPEELHIMLAFMRTDADLQAQQSVHPSLPNIDWNQFLKLVRHHRVYPQLYADMKTSELIPADVLQVLHSRFRSKCVPNASSKRGDGTGLQDPSGRTGYCR